MNTISQQLLISGTVLLTGGSLASAVAVALVLWGLCAWKA
jgi:hypothetical protein